jgi:2-desacetyl-2-hydroxyethyl bacteriochlorophyllide A dehydrogenase
MSVRNANRVFLSAPEEVEIQKTELEPMGKRSVLVKSMLSGISHGTEMALYRGTAPQLARSFDRDKRIFPPLEEGEGQPGKLGRGLGYENVGEVVEIGPEVTSFRLGDLIWCWAPHVSFYVFEEGEKFVGWPPPRGYYSFKLPSGVTAEEGIFTALSEIALTAVHDSSVKVGDYVAIFGAGVIGLLCTQLALLNGARQVFVSEPIESRRKVAEAWGAIAMDPRKLDVSMSIREQTKNRGVDVSIETSGNQKAIHEAIRCTGLGGRVVTLGFYQGGAPDLRLGDEWHHNRISMRSSMSAWLCPSRYYPQWEIMRSFETVLDLIARRKLAVADMITHRIPLEQAAEAYHLIDKHPEEVLKVALVYS